MSSPDGASGERFTPLSPQAFHILVALGDGEKHGYAIMRDVEAQTDGAMALGPGTLYGSLKRLLAQGLVGEADSRPDPELDDERRRYYRLSALGRRVVAGEVKRLETQLRAARRVSAFAEG